MQEKEILFDDLMSKLYSGDLSESERDILYSLMKESELFAEKYRETMRLYALLHIPKFEAEKKAKKQRIYEKLYLTKKGKRISLPVYIRQIAAVVFLVIISSLSAVYVHKQLDGQGHVAFHEAIVPLGSQTKIILSDGSAVTLNSGSILRYPTSFGKKERSVHLRGEGYFEVATDLSRTFTVNVEDVKVKVTGTKFNVKSYQEDKSVEVDLIEGGVDLISKTGNLQLNPDEKATYDIVSKKMIKKPVEAKKSALWTTGKLSFVSTSLRDILKDVERKYNVKIHVDSELVQKESFSGTIDLNLSLDEVFNFLDVDNKYVFNRTGNVIMLKNR